MATVVMEPTAVAVKVAGQPAVAAAKGMAVDGQVKRATHLAEGAAMHRLAVAKIRFGVHWPNFFVTRRRPAHSGYGGPSRQIFANKEVSWHITINVRGVIALYF